MKINVYKPRFINVSVPQETHHLLRPKKVQTHLAQDAGRQLFPEPSDSSRLDWNTDQQENTTMVIAGQGGGDK